MNYQTLKVEFNSTIGTISFNRPDKGNAFNEIMISELENVLDAVEQSAELRALIITGEGKCFMAGGDIKMSRSGFEKPYQFFLFHDRVTRIGMRIERLHIPVIAAINGPAVGGGFELALACDFRVMGKDAHLAMPEAGLGIMPGSGGTPRLVKMVGKEKTLYIVLAAKRIDAEEAMKMGLVGWVVSQQEVMSKANDLASQIISKAPVSVATIKRAVNLAADMPMEGAIDYCQYAALSLIGTEDSKEGFDSFLEKREPVWRGR